jgi:hypothetical protein
MMSCICMYTYIYMYMYANMDGPTATKSIRDLGYMAPIFGKEISFIYHLI